MLFKLDENMPELLVADLQAAGHGADTVVQEQLGGTNDSTIAARAAKEGRVFVSFDLDFSDIRRYQPGTHPGIVVFRLRRQDIGNCQSAFARFLANVAETDVTGNLIVVEDKNIRIRRPGGVP